MSTFRFAALLVLPVSVLGLQGPDRDSDSPLCDRALAKPVSTAVREELTAAIARAGAADANGRVEFLRGCEEWSNGRDDKAAAQFEKAAKLEPASALYQFWLGRVYGEQAQKANVLRQPSLAKRVREHFERAVALDSNYVDARNGLVQYYLQAPGFMGGSIDKARAQAAEITKRNPYRGGFVSVDIARHEHDTTAMKRSYETLIASFPDSLGPYVNLLSVLGAQKDWTATWALVDRLSRSRPNEMIVRYLEGRIAAESGLELDRGEGALREYLKHAPAPNEPSLAAAHWRLGMIQERRANRDAARAEYQAALSIDPTFKNAKDALAKLK